MGARVSPLFLVAEAVCLGVAFLAALGLPPLRERRPVPLRGGVRSLLRRRSFLVLLAVSYLTSSGAAIIYAFLGIRLQELGGSADLVGVAFALGAASELPVVAFGGPVLARLGASRLLGLAIAVYAARLVAYSVLPSRPGSCPSRPCTASRTEPS